MKHLTLALAALALAGAAALQPPPAAAHVVDQTVACEKWKNDHEWRCLFKDTSGGPTATVVVKNTSKETVACQADEFHSICHLSSSRIDSGPHLLAPDAQEELRVLCPGGSITCREIFIDSCTVNGVAQKCTAYLSAEGRTLKGNKQ